MGKIDPNVVFWAVVIAVLGVLLVDKARSKLFSRVTLKVPGEPPSQSPQETKAMPMEERES